MGVVVGAIEIQLVCAIEINGLRLQGCFCDGALGHGRHRTDGNSMSER